MFSFNTINGSTAGEVKVDFKYGDVEITKLTNVNMRQINTKYNVIGFLRWLGETHNVPATPKKIKNALLNDGTGFYLILAVIKTVSFNIYHLC